MGVAACLSLAQAPPPVADYVYLFPHAIDRALGPIELLPRSHPWGTHDIAAHSAGSWAAMSSSHRHESQ